MTRRIAIIGGGISGLAAAWRLFEEDPGLDVSVYEASPRFGGILGTVARDGWLIERGPDMFTTREPWAVELCRKLGIDEELIGVNAENRRALVLRDGKLHPVPDGFTLLSPSKIGPLLRTPLLSWGAKLRMGGEFFVSPRSPKKGDESLAAFARRRFGQEAYERLIQPLVGGIYTADPEKLSMRATMMQFVQQEQTHGGLLRAMLWSGRSKKASEPSESGARYGSFVAPRTGIGRLPEALTQRLPAHWLKPNSPVVNVHLADEDGSWRLTIDLPSGERRVEAVDDVIYAAPAPKATILARVDRGLSEQLLAIPHAGASVVVVGCRRDQLSHPLDAFGLVVPTVEKRRVVAISFSSVKFPERAPEGKVILRVFVGGALQPELAELPDDALRALAIEELSTLLGLRGEPEFVEIARWLGAMPQYHVGHLERVKQIRATEAAIPRFALCGNAYEGVGIPFCVRSGTQAAERILGKRVAS